jgi:hypothetical protein
MLIWVSGTEEEATRNVCMACTPLNFSLLRPLWTKSQMTGAIFSIIFIASCASTMPKKAPPPAPTAATHTPDEYCAAKGGTYLGDLRCQLRDGYIAKMLAGTDAARAAASDFAVRAPNLAWALATTALIFEANGSGAGTLTGVTATPDSIENERKQLADFWNIHSEDDLRRTLGWLQFQGHRAEFDELGLGSTSAAADLRLLAGSANELSNWPPILVAQANRKIRCTVSGHL